MNRSTVSVCHCLKLIPISRVTKFVRLRSRVVIETLRAPDDAGAVPGTVTASHTSENGLVKKKIAFERSDVSEKTANLLEAYKSSRLIATYVDESGLQRVAGSPSYPLKLDYTTEGGSFSVVLQGEDTATDAFLAE